MCILQISLFWLVVNNYQEIAETSFAYLISQALKELHAWRENTIREGNTHSWYNLNLKATRRNSKDMCGKGKSIILTNLFLQFASNT